MSSLIIRIYLIILIMLFIILKHTINSFDYIYHNILIFIHLKMVISLLIIRINHIFFILILFL